LKAKDALRGTLINRRCNMKIDIKPTLSQVLAEGMARRIGSWRFLIIQSIFLAFWIALNVMVIIQHWDPYPFILLNLMLSFQAAYTGPILLIATNRQSEVDRKMLSETHDAVIEELFIVKEELSLAREEREDMKVLLHEVHSITKEGNGNVL
jgi:uncharacterized membrane protein